MSYRPVVGALAVVLAVSLAGCGVPRSGEPVVVGDAPRSGGRSVVAGANRPGPDGASDAQQLVERYFKAPAWGNHESRDLPSEVMDTQQWMRTFLTDRAQRAWQPGQDIIVVNARVGSPISTPDGSRVQVVLDPVGVLTRTGSIEPRPDLKPETRDITVIPVEDDQDLRIDDPPPGMLLSTAGLSELYDVQPIYFWDASQKYLVPDQRYISSAIGVDNRPNVLARWLRGGPSTWLRNAVSPVPELIEIQDNIVVSDNTRLDTRLVINLTNRANGVKDQLPKFVSQLHWSLRPLIGPVELRIAGQAVPLTVDPLDANPEAPRSGQSEPPRLAVHNGRVISLSPDLTLPVLASGDNNGVQSAAIAGAPNQPVALVRQDSGGRVRLWLGEFDRDQEAPRYTATELTAQVMSRPTWLTGPRLSVLVSVDGRLYDVAADGTRAPQDVTPGSVGPVSAIAVAPDGRRLAFVAGTQVYIAALVFDGDAVKVGPPQQVRVPVTDVVGVAWRGEAIIAVAGRSSGQSMLVDVTVDGALATLLPLKNLPGLVVTRVVAKPVVRPTDSPREPKGPILIEANDRAYRVFSDSVDQLDPPGNRAPGSSPNLRAPFFRD